MAKFKLKFNPAWKYSSGMSTFKIFKTLVAGVIFIIVGVAILNSNDVAAEDQGNKLIYLFPVLGGYFVAVAIYSLIRRKLDD